MVISKKTIIFQGFRGGPTFSKVGPTFSGGGGGGGGGKKPIKPVIFQGGGVWTPYPNSGPHLKYMSLYPHMYQNVYYNLLQKYFRIMEWPFYKHL